MVSLLTMEVQPLLLISNIFGFSFFSKTCRTADMWKVSRETWQNGKGDGEFSELLQWGQHYAKERWKLLFLGWEGIIFTSIPSSCYFTFISLEISRRVGKVSSLSSAAEKEKLPVRASQSTGSSLCEIKNFQFIGGWGPPLGEKGSDPNYPPWAGKWDMWIDFRGPRKEFEDKPCTFFII